MKLKQKMTPRQKPEMRLSPQAVVAVATTSFVIIMLGLFFYFNIGNVRDILASTKTYYSMEDGDWNDPETWGSGGQNTPNGIPGTEDHVVLYHKVNVQGTNVKCRNLKISAPDAGLTFTGSNSSLTIAKDFVVSNDFNLVLKNTQALKINGNLNINKCVATILMTDNSSIGILKDLFASKAGINFTMENNSLLKVSGNFDLDELNTESSINITGKGTLSTGKDFEASNLGEEFFISMSGEGKFITGNNFNISNSVKKITQSQKDSSGIVVNGNYRITNGDKEVEINLKDNSTLNINKSFSLTGNKKKTNVILSGNSTGKVSGSVVINESGSFSGISLEDNAIFSTKSSFSISNSTGTGKIELKDNSVLRTDSNLVFNSIGKNLSMTLSGKSSVRIRGDLDLIAEKSNDLKIKATDRSTIELGKNIIRQESPKNYGSLVFANDASLIMNGNQQQILASSEGNGNDGISYNNIVFRSRSNTKPQFKTESKVSVEGTIYLDTGVIKVDTTSSLVLGKNAGLKNISPNCYIDGSYQKKGIDSFTFFLKGGAEEIVKVGISATTSSSTFSATYHPEGHRKKGLAPGLNHVSTSKYWDIKRLSGNGNVKVILYWDDAEKEGITNLSDLTVAHFNSTSGNWENIGVSKVSGSTGSKGSGYIVSNEINNFSPFTFGSGSGMNPLPVELLAFEAQVLSKKVDLIWKTASEKNNSHFEIQKSKDGKVFYSIGEVSGFGNSMSIKNYSYKDYEPLNGINYYRLKQVDFNGDFEYSGIIIADMETPLKKSPQVIKNIFPVPFTDKFIVKYSPVKSQKVKITLTSITGAEIFSKVAGPGNNTFTFSEGNQLPKGNYFLTLESGGKTETRKIVKR